MPDLRTATVQFAVDLLLQFVDDPGDCEEVRRIGQRAILEVET